MKRRRLIGLVGISLSAGCVSSWPEPTGPRAPPEEPSRPPPAAHDDLVIEEWDIGAAADGSVQVFGTLRNGGADETTVTVTAAVTVDGDTLTERTTVTVSAESTADFQLTYDIEYSEASNLSVTLELR